MTLSNFDWTDKQTVKWFIMLPTGHEGPYSLETLNQRFEQGKISRKTQVWAEGLPGFVAAEEVLFPKPVVENISSAVTYDHEEYLPPIPEDEPSLPPMPELPAAPARKWKKAPLLTVFLLALILLSGRQWLKSNEAFSIHRHPKMSPELYQRISEDFKFESWNKEIFFREYLATDLSHIWLVTGSAHKCDVEASFYSIPGKMLALADDKVAMRSKGKLRGHVVELSSFEFTAGNKIIPGLYEMDVKASACEWDGLAAKIGNGFNDPTESYVARTRVVLFPKGAQEFYRILEKLIKKKTEITQKTEGAEELFWQDLQQKIQTLLAITLQIEQHFIDFLDKDPKEFNKNLKPMVETYTRKFGHTLTNFVVANENYFKEIAKSDLKDISRKKAYEPMVRVASKNIGLESMKIIENLQGLKNPKQDRLEKTATEARTMFKRLKEDLNRKIIQVSEDRSR